MMSVARQESKEDFKTVIRTYAVEEARLTSSIGWNGRRRFHEFTSDHHLFMRELQWNRFCIQIRDHLLAQLERVFAYIGTLTGASPCLIRGALPTVKDVEDREKRFLKPGCRFSDVLAPFGMRS